MQVGSWIEEIREMATLGESKPVYRVWDFYGWRHSLDGGDGDPGAKVFNEKNNIIKWWWLSGIKHKGRYFYREQYLWNWPWEMRKVANLNEWQRVMSLSGVLEGPTGFCGWMNTRSIQDRNFVSKERLQSTQGLRAGRHQKSVRQR